ncbi:MAG: DUF445 family protein [Candidatus Latescibacteria bacterium]|nr:DUF445 family protein [Candidatus Latescibacterota bacterium]
MTISWVQMAASAGLGALIGYGTNFLAIKSLFRPLRPRWYSLGWQGVIPRNRGRLAHNIARVVGQDLLARGYLLEQLDHPSLQGHLRNFVVAQLGRGLDLSGADIWARLPESWRGPGLDGLVLRLLQQLAVWSDGEQGRELRQQLADWVSQAAQESPLGALASRDQVAEWAAALGRGLGAESTQMAVSEQVRSRLQHWLQADRPLEEALSPELRAVLHEQLRHQVPAITRRLAQWLQDPDNVEHLSKRIFQALEEYDGDSLWGRLFSEMGVRVFRRQIRRAIEERLPQVAYDYLHSGETQRQVEEQLIGAIDAFLRRPVGEWGAERGEELADKLGSLAANWLASPQVQSHLQTMLVDLYRRHADQPLGQLLPASLWAAGRQRLLDGLRLTPTQAAAWAEPVGSWLRQWLGQNRTPFRLLLGLEGERETALVDWLQDRAGQLLRREVPALIDHFDVEGLVRTKIEAFDLLRVERLIKDIISDQLRYINLLGAVLGGMVGLLLPFLNAWIAALGG